MVATASGIVREEGAMKLWRGVTPALYRHVVYRYLFTSHFDAIYTIFGLMLALMHRTMKLIFWILFLLFSGVRIAIYDRLRKNLDTSEDHSGLPLWEAAICGVTAGGIAQW